MLVILQRTSHSSLSGLFQTAPSALLPVSTVTWGSQNHINNLVWKGPVAIILFHTPSFQFAFYSLPPRLHLPSPDSSGTEPISSPLQEAHRPFMYFWPKKEMWAIKTTTSLHQGHIHMCRRFLKQKDALLWPRGNRGRALLIKYYREGRKE